MKLSVTMHALSSKDPNKDYADTHFMKLSNDEFVRFSYFGIVCGMEEALKKKS